MDFETLISTCRAGVVELRDSSGCKEQYSLNLTLWRQRLGNTQCWLNEIEGVQHCARLGKLTEHALTLVHLVLQLPATCGHHYRETVREAACATLVALCRLPELYAQMRMSRQSPAAFLWNQTLRLRDIPENCVSHLLVRWERWGCQLREACEEFRLLLNDDEEDGDTRNVSVLGISESASVRECESLVRLVRSLLRKVRVRCISQLREDDFIVIDELYRRAEMVSAVTEELVAILSPPHDSNLIAGISSRIVAEAINLAETAIERCPENHHKWFQMCSVHLDSLLSPVIERNPIR